MAKFLLVASMQLSLIIFTLADQSLIAYMVNGSTYGFIQMCTARAHSQLALGRHAAAVTLITGIGNARTLRIYQLIRKTEYCLPQ